MAASFAWTQLFLFGVVHETSVPINLNPPAPMHGRVVMYAGEGCGYIIPTGDSTTYSTMEVKCDGVSIVYSATERPSVKYQQKAVSSGWLIWLARHLEDENFMLTEERSIPYKIVLNDSSQLAVYGAQ